MCGLRRPEDIRVVNELLPEYIGFIFAKKSRRYLTPEQAMYLKKLLNHEIKAVGVFVNEDGSLIKKLVENGIIDIVQLHGNEDREYVSALRNQIACPIFQAFRIESKEDVERACASPADEILLDAGEGGSGQRFDWSLLNEVNRRFILAGGLDEKKVKEAIEQFHPFGVDVSSGIETDGYKDEEKMIRFVQAVNRADELFSKEKSKKKYTCL